MNENRTTFIDIICNHAMIEIADIRLQKEMTVSPARFFRKMSFFVLNAIPRFNRPPEARIWMECTPPSFDDMEYIVPDQITESEITIETGKTGYEIVSVINAKDDGYGSFEYIPVQIKDYDAETGIITLDGNSVFPCELLIIDFYTDGAFKRELSADMKRILGLLVQVVWENRFANDYLLQQPKIKDRSFDVGSEANHMRAATERMRFLNEQVNQELKRFEQNATYSAVVLHDKTSITHPDNQE